MASSQRCNYLALTTHWIYLRHCLTHWKAIYAWSTASGQSEPRKKQKKATNSLSFYPFQPVAGRSVKFRMAINKLYMYHTRDILSSFQAPHLAKYTGTCRKISFAILP